MKIMKRYILKVNSVDSVQELLQELYDEVMRNINNIETEMNKIKNSTQLYEESIEGKTKYAKAMNDFIVSKDKAIGRKMEIAKLMADIIKSHSSGDIITDSNILDENWDNFKESLTEDSNYKNVKVPDIQEYKL